MARNGPQGQPEWTGKQPWTASGGSGFTLCGLLPYLPLSGPQCSQQSHGSHMGLLCFHPGSWIFLTPIREAEGSDRQGPEPAAAVALWLWLCAFQGSFLSRVKTEAGVIFLMGQKLVNSRASLRTPEPHIPCLCTFPCLWHVCVQRSFEKEPAWRK